MSRNRNSSDKTISTAPKKQRTLKILSPLIIDEAGDDLQANAAGKLPLSEVEKRRRARDKNPSNENRLSPMPRSLDTLSLEDIEKLSVKEFVEAIRHTKDPAKLALVDQITEAAIGVTQESIKRELVKPPYGIAANGKIKLRFAVESRQTTTKGTQHYVQFKAEFVDKTTGKPNTRQVRKLTLEEKKAALKLLEIASQDAPDLPRPA